MMIELRSLVEAALRRFGCHLEAKGENLLHVAISADSPMRQILDVGDIAYLALEEIEEDSLVGLEPVRHLVPGSIYLKRFIGILTEHGTVGDMRLPGEYARPDDLSAYSFLAGAIRDTIDCVVARSINVDHRCVTFHFVVDLFAIEASQVLVSVTFDFDAKRVISDPDISRLRVAEPAIIEILDTELKVAMTTILENVRLKACRQIESYAEEHSNERSSAMRELKRQAKKEIDEATSQPFPTSQSGDESFENSRDEIARDWAQRIRHVESQYKAEGAQITLVSATRQIRPFIRYEIHFPGRTTVDDTWEILYDLTCGNFLLPECQSCGSTAETLVIGDGLCTHPICDRCAEISPGCSHRTCKPCVCKCCLCSSTMCRDCRFQCSHNDCSLSYCDKHKISCSKCEACVCRQHRQFCRSCQKIFCNQCYHNHQGKQADCGHLLACGSKARLCRICKNAVCIICTVRCGHCNRYACNKHIVRCFYCQSRVCERCVGLDCESCGAKCCKEHSFQCKVCLHCFCYEHAQRCAVCNRAVCCDDVILCGSCQSPLCPRHGQAAAEDFIVDGMCEHENKTLLLLCSCCQERIPHRLLTQHDRSDGFLCIECRSECFECNTWLSEFEIGQCVTCGRFLCDACLESHANLFVSRLEKFHGDV